MPIQQQLHQLVLDNARRAFEDARLKVAPRELFGFCLYSDDSATTIVHTVGILEDDFPTQGDEEYWNPHEWEEFGGLLDDASQSLLQPSQDWLTEHYAALNPSNDQYDDFRNEVFDTIVGALRDLRNEGVFGTADSQIYLCFSVSQWTEEDVLPWVEELNPASTVEAYKRAMGIEM